MNFNEIIYATDNDEVKNFEVLFLLGYWLIK